jgi:hypothetical protein
MLRLLSVVCCLALLTACAGEGPLPGPNAYDDSVSEPGAAEGDDIFDEDIEGEDLLDDATPQAEPTDLP